MRLTNRPAFAIVIAVSMLAACNPAASPSEGTSPSGAASPSAGTSPSTGASLTGQPWALSAVTGKTPAFQVEVPDYQQADYTVTFNTDGTYSGRAACNQIAGTYKTSGNSLSITAGASTLALCVDYTRALLVTDFGLIFAHSLTNAATYSATNDTLMITLTDGGTMTFGPLQAVPSSAQSSAKASLPRSAHPPPELLGRTWKLTGINTRMPAFQGVVPEADQSKYTIELQADGTFNVKADCNQISGRYEVHRGGSTTDNPLDPEPGGGGLGILPGPSTLAACPPGSLADLFVIGLSGGGSYAIAGNQMTLTTGDGEPYALQFIS